MNAQEIFDKVARHLLTQNEKSISPHASNCCAYRGAYGRSCAVGCLISDEDYAPVIEGASVCSLLMDTKLKLPAYFVEHGTLLSQLQLVHDMRTVGEWPSQLRLLGLSSGLDVGVIYELRPHLRPEG